MEQELIGKVDKLDKSKRLTILKFLQEINARVIECNDGTRVNLDLLDGPQKKKLQKMVDDLSTIDPKHQI